MSYQCTTSRLSLALLRFIGLCLTLSGCLSCRSLSPTWFERSQLVELLSPIMSTFDLWCLNFSQRSESRQFCYANASLVVYSSSWNLCASWLRQPSFSWIYRRRVNICWISLLCCHLPNSMRSFSSWSSRLVSLRELLRLAGYLLSLSYWLPSKLWSSSVWQLRAAASGFE